MSVLRWTDEQLAAHQARHGRKPAKSGAGEAQQPSKPSKYRNKPVNGYASQKEAKRAEMLRHMEKHGLIRCLREQVKYVLIPKQAGERECSYIADFVYQQAEKVADDLGFANLHWRDVVEDCKGMRTDVYRIKRKLMLHIHGIRIRET